MTEGKVIGIYVGLVRRPYRFVIRRRITGRLQNFELHHPASLREFVAELLKVFTNESTNFMSALAQLDDKEFMSSKHKTRRYFAKSKDLLYIGNPKLTKQYAQEHSGYWYVTNIGAKEVSHISHMIAQVANIPCESISKLSL